MSITHWPKADQPREKLLAHGAKHLTHAELLAIFLLTGTKNKSALDLAKDLLAETGGLHKLLTIHPHEFCQKPGLGKAKYAAVQAAIELGRRYHEEIITRGEILTNSQITQRYLAVKLRDYPHEVFACLFLNNQNHLLAYEELFRGTLSEASIYPREVVKRALAHNAAKLIFAHNHPSGNALPSQADQEITAVLKEALALVDIQVVDHIIIGHSVNFSFAEKGLI